MPNLIDVNPEEAEKKVSIFKRYKDEVLQIAFAAVIAYLFLGQKTLERDMRNYLINDRVAAFEKMNISTEVIKQNTEVMGKVKDVLINNSETLQRIEHRDQERNLNR